MVPKGVWSNLRGFFLDFEMCFAPQQRALFRHRNFQKWSEHGVFCTCWLRNALRAITARTSLTSQLPKAVRSWGVLYILPSKFASRHNGVHFFDISTSKSGPSMVCFSHFDLDMCFAPQRRALFRHHNFQKWSDVGVLCRFWLRKAATVCNVSSLIWPAGSAPAALAASGATKCHKSLEKHTVSRLSYLFAHLDLLSSDSLSSLIFSLLLFSSLFFCSTSAFHLSILSEVWLLNILNFLRLYTHIYIIYICFTIYIWFIFYLFIYFILYIYIYIYVCVCTYIHIYLHIFTHTHIYIYMHLHKCIYIYYI